MAVASTSYEGRLTRPTPAQLVLWAGLAAVVAPTLVTLANEAWTRDIEAQGPIVLVTGLWLLWRQWPDFRANGSPGSLHLTLPILLFSLAGFAAGSAFEITSLQAAGAFGVVMSVLHAKFGFKILLKHWFPLLYLGFVVPPPGSLLADVTGPLKQLVSTTATDWLQAAGMPVARQGVTIFIAQYQLLVEDACSGMNSLVGLTAVSLLYIYLMRGSSWIYSLILVVFVIPIAIIANIIRIIVLVLLTYYAGNDVAQGYLHSTAGLVLFATALACVFGLDRLLHHARSRLRPSP